MPRTTGPGASRPDLPAATYLATGPASPGQRRFAWAVALVSLAFLVAAVPFAQQPLAPVWSFIPIYEAALVLNDLITALLLFGQYRIARSRAVLVLAGGYVFTAAATVAHALSFPGLFAAEGLLGAGPQTTAWIYMFWHGGFPLVVAAYALLRAREPEPRPRPGRAAPPIVATIAVALAAAAGLTLLATAGQELLTPIMSGNRYTPAMRLVVGSVWLASVPALLLLWRLRPQSVLDVWLMVVLCAWLADIALAAVFNAGRFDLGFYVGRIYGLIAASLVLGVLLLENGVLHARLAEAHAGAQRRSRELEQLSRQLEQLNAQLAQSNEQLQAQTRLKSEFLASMSHELRTPLNAIIGFSDMLRTGTREADKQRRFAQHIYDGGHHLLTLVNDILDLSKIEAGKVELVLEPVHAEAALTDALAMLSHQAQARSVKLRLEADGPLGRLRLDRRRLKQILLNLLSNALKFTPEQGEVVLRARHCDRARAASALPGPGDGMRLPLPDGEQRHFLEISVEDTGIGIAGADLRRLFAPFVQVPNALTRSVEGTGLGLVIVHRLAELHGGTVAVTSLPGRGTCFTVWLGWREDRDAYGTAASPAQAQPRRVALVIEDEDAAAALMREQLESQGFAVRHAPSAEAALAMVGEFTPDLITLDILLPGIDGWQFLARLREAGVWEAVPVVVVSLVADEGRGVSLGASLVLQKPVELEGLVRGLERLGLTPHDGRAVTVLVVDDDPAAVELLATQLHQREYLVLRAHGGREGIELARRFRPDLITLDLEMPGVNGFHVAEALRAHPTTARIPIIVVTGKELSAAERQRLNGQILDIVGKSEFNHGRFTGEVQRAMARGEAAWARLGSR